MALPRMKVELGDFTPKPGGVLVIPPQEIIDDELRFARLEHYLEAEFPHLEISVAPENKLGGRQSAVGLTPRKDGSAPLSDEEGQATIDQVIDAVLLFAEYGMRRH